MAFKISSATEGIYTWPVSVMIPIDGGKHRKEEFKATFKRWHKNAIPADSEEAEEERGIEFFKAILVGWSGIKDDDGEEVPFSEEKLEEFLGVPLFVSSVVSAYQSSNGLAKEKN